MEPSEYPIMFIVGIIAFIILFTIILIKPNSAFSIYIYSWRYRTLRRLHSSYQWSQRQTPPHSYEYFKKNAIQSLQETRQIHIADLNDIILMLNVDDFTRYYFEEKIFSVETYRKMMDDYRSGMYKKKEYNKIKILKHNLPLEISSSEKAFNDFYKFVKAGWFDSETGMYILNETRTKQYIGVAIKTICQRNSIRSPEKIFANVFPEESKTIRDWLRGNARSPIVTKKIEEIVLAIIKTPL